MWKRMLIGMVQELVSKTLMDYVLSIRKVTRRNETILMFARMKLWMANSNSSTTRRVSELLPTFGADLD